MSLNLLRHMEMMMTKIDIHADLVCWENRYVPIQIKQHFFLKQMTCVFRTNVGSR